MELITYNVIMKIAETDPNLRKTFKGVFHQVAWTASGTAVGGLVGGPVGAVVGSVAGTVVGYLTVDDYDSMLKVLSQMNEDSKRRLLNAVVALVGSSAQSALLTFLESEANRKRFINLLKQFA